MKFKITKLNLESALRLFDKKDKEYAEIELEPISNTAIQSIYEQSLRNESFHKGYHYGYKEGFYEGRKKEWKCNCGCGGNNCALRFCDENCKYLNL